MIVVMKPEATEEEIKHVVDTINQLGCQAHVSKGVERTLIGAVGDETKLKERPLDSFPGVDSVKPIQKPYKLANRQMHVEDTIIDINGVKVGGRKLVVIAGPCSVESREGILGVAREVKAGGAAMLRGGAFKPRTSPYAFQGMGEEGLKLLAETREATGLPVVTEVMDPRQVALIEKYADVLQIGARNVQNFNLLKEVGLSRKPVFLKRGMSTTLQELLMSAEYIMANGNHNVILCERGIRTFETAMRNTLDIGAVAWLKAESHLPVFIDPSHAAGIYQWVGSLARAAVAAGADGLMIEVHPNPEEAFSDGSQSLMPFRFKNLMNELRPIAEAVGRSI
ncbi:3-deoxy-7-phosphoheptulonate synthase [Candidatus Sumerlaeota bacterium]|nr:3-deoxy-7-phosphoheptulonate synthase [Candidatus Sumerlaeota bacterium]